MSCGYLHRHSETPALEYGYRHERMDRHRSVAPWKGHDLVGMLLYEPVAEVEGAKIQCRHPSTARATALSTGPGSQRTVLEMVLSRCTVAVADTGSVKAGAIRAKSADKKTHHGM